MDDNITAALRDTVPVYEERKFIVSAAKGVFQSSANLSRHEVPVLLLLVDVITAALGSRSRLEGLPVLGDLQRISRLSTVAYRMAAQAVPTTHSRTASRFFLIPVLDRLLARRRHYPIESLAKKKVTVYGILHFRAIQYKR